MVAVRRLAEILAEHLPDGPIGLLAIDVEGHEEAVIRGHDWQRWRPLLVAVEVLEDNLHDALMHPTTRAVAEYGYAPVAFTGATVVLRDATAV